jgi:hypothetical protein
MCWGPPAVRGSPQQQRKVYCSIGESPCGASRPGDMLHITNLHTIGNYFTYRMSASVVDTKIELMFPSSELAPLISKLDVPLKLSVCSTWNKRWKLSPLVCRLLTVESCHWRMAQWFNLKGLSHEIDLAFDDMFGTSSAASRRWLPRLATFPITLTKLSPRPERVW